MADNDTCNDMPNESFEYHEIGYGCHYEYVYSEKCFVLKCFCPNKLHRTIYCNKSEGCETYTEQNIIKGKRKLIVIVRCYCSGENQSYCSM